MRPAQTVALRPGVLRATAPAKVNLGLRILGRRADGMHELESVFAPLDWCDDLEIRIAPAASSAVELVLDEPVPGVPEGAPNLAARAARAFLEAAGATAEVAIRLRKRIPHAAGLGGGSSDAAAVLRSLAAHAAGALTDEVLRSVALELGADVPFFLDPRPSLVRGVGERIEPLPGLAPLSLLLAGPDLPLATAAVFGAFDVLAGDGDAGEPGRSGSPRPALSRWAQADRSASLSDLLENDLEPAAVRLCPPLARLRQSIRALGAEGVGMSGSGPTLFGIFEDREAAEAARAALLRQPAGWARVATTLDSG